MKQQQLAARLELKVGQFSTGFQSRLSKRWLGLFTDDLVIERANAADKRVLVVSPSFVADCLETWVEVGYDYQKIFIDHGGNELVLVHSLNDQEYWVEALTGIVSGNYKAKKDATDKL